jgi:hypothetical protein
MPDDWSARTAQIAVNVLTVPPFRPSVQPYYIVEWRPLLDVHFRRLAACCFAQLSDGRNVVADDHRLVEFVQEAQLGLSSLM